MANQIKSFPSSTGVYSIGFLKSENVYIGSAGATVGLWPSERGFWVRWRKHLRELRKNKHHSIALQRGYNKYGEKNLIFKVLEECPANLCLEREDFYILKFDSYKNGYNMQPKAQSSIGRKNRPESIEKRRETCKEGRNLYSQQCINFYSEGKSWDQISKILPISRTTIAKILKENQQIIRKNGESFKKKIFCYRVNGEFIGEFNGARECSERLNLKCEGNIREIARNSRLKSYKGYTFSYSILSEEEIKNKVKNLDRLK